MGITQIYAQAFCVECAGTHATGSKASSIGYGTTASGLASFAGGISSEASGAYSFAFGNNAKALTDYAIAFGNNAVVNNFANSIAIGNYATSNAVNSYVFGQYLNGTGSNSLTFGMGTSSFAPLVNNKSNSIMFGVTNKSSLTIAKYGNSDRGYIGIGTDDPQEMAHVVGKLLIERTEQTASSLQFKHPLMVQGRSLYWDIYSEIDGLKFNTVSSGVGTQRMVINENGVGIGSSITSPQAKLHVENNILGEGNITTLNKFVLSPNSNAT